jgi:pyruvate dehydrogenase (quinone)
MERRGQIVFIGINRTRQELAMPPNTTLDQAYHFGMFPMKAALDGRAKELIDPAKTNLSR